jgi:putative Mn2+ efflux pump MntP
LRQLLVLLGVLVPLGVDTFALAAALGMAGLQSRDRLRISLVLTAFEAGMPIAGSVIGLALGKVIGGFAGYLGIAVLAIAGVLLIRPGRDEDKDDQRLKLLARARGLAIIDLGLSISVDELTIGFSAGLLGLSLGVTVAWIAVQAFLAAQLGVRLGNRIGEALRERAEKLAGLALIAVAALLLVLRLRGV